MAGYSATPLLRKLGFGPGMQVLTIDPPDGYADWLGDLPAGLALVRSARGEVAAAHVFVTEAADLARKLLHFRKQLRQDGFLWVSWPKKASGMPTDVTEDRIRDLALPLGFVDVKVCAVSEIWSGLKLVIRLSERTPTQRPRRGRA